MSAEMQNPIPEQTPEQQKAVNDKELNFARLRKQVDEERAARQQAEQRVAEIERIYQEKIASKHSDNDDDDTSDEPYVDHRRLEKKLAKFSQKTKQETQQEIKQEVEKALSEERRSQWLRNNPDFYEVMGHAQTFADKDPELAETILQLPDNFERQKLVYKNIKMLKLHQKEEPKSSIQDKVDQVRRGAFYQPTGVGSAPYSQQGDFSEVGQKNSYAKMQELKKKLRI
jgi:hypothetical protein